LCLLLCKELLIFSCLSLSLLLLHFALRQSCFYYSAFASLVITHLWPASTVLTVLTVSNYSYEELYLISDCISGSPSRAALFRSSQTLYLFTNLLVDWPPMMQHNLAPRAASSFPTMPQVSSPFHSILNPGPYSDFFGNHWHPHLVPELHDF
jgi:hypothetical protein